MLYLFVGISFIFLCSTVGSLFPFIYNKEKGGKKLDFLNGLAAGIMLAAAIWSLLVPAFEKEENGLYVILSFIMGVIIIFIFDLIQSKEKTYFSKMYFAVTFHNIPEGIVVGLSIAIGILNNELIEGLLIAFAIGIQNVPESIALSHIIYNETSDKNKSFLLSMFSGIVEPIFGLIAFALVGFLEKYVGIFLGIASGTMIYVALGEMIPNAICEKEELGKIGVIVGFILMMILDVFL